MRVTWYAEQLVFSWRKSNELDLPGFEKLVKRLAKNDDAVWVRKVGLIEREGKKTWRGFGC